MKTVYNSNDVHEKKSSFSEKAEQAFGTLCCGDNGKSCCRDYWCPTQNGHSFLHEVEISHSLSTSQLRIEWGGQADESYFGGVRKGKRGRGASGKVAVFGLFKWGGKVFTAIAPNARTETLLPIIEERVTPDSIVYTDTFKAYNALDITESHHMRFNGGNHQNLYKRLKYWHCNSRY